jgi:hypothetical protein
MFGPGPQNRSEPGWDRIEKATMNEEQVAFDGLIRSRAAARLLGMSEWSLRKLAHTGELPYIQQNRTSPMLFDPVDLRAWIEREKIRGGT